ncbi:hypothetical protein ABT227_26515 [Streptomyces venezuelae]
MARDGLLPPLRPFVPGFDVSGRITAVGEGVDPGRIGTPVTALTTGGARAEVVLAPAALSLDIGSLPPRTAAGPGRGAPTAYDLINTAARVRPGESVLIHAAAGSVGMLAAQFARLAGAGRITGVAGSARRAPALVAEGTVRVDVSAECSREGLATAVQRLAGGATHGKGVLRIA